MKPSSKKWITSSIKIATLVVIFAFLASCAQDEAALEKSDAQVSQATLSDQPSTPFSTLSTGCPDDLENDGCNFISGTGRDHPNQYLMVDLMNGCRTEPLPSTCSWIGYTIQTRNIEVDLNNCCYPYSSLNAAMNNWKALAAANRPDSNYLITGYERINGYMVTVYGPYRMVIKVTYRKKGMCLVKGETDDLPK